MAHGFYYLEVKIILENVDPVWNSWHAHSLVYTDSANVFIRL